MASALPSTEFTIVHTTGGISGDFSPVSLGGATSPVDYLSLAGARSADNLNYNVGFGLTWLAGATLGNGVFTLAGPADTFNVDVALANQSPSATGWDGTTLTKEGAGNLLLSAVNSYTGPTLINAGTLTTGIANAFATGSAVSVNGGATLALNGFNQIVNDLSGAGTVNLGSAVMTANNTGSTTFAGLVSGTGSVTKTGAGTLTLSGANTYSGGTTIAAGTLTATNGSALGTGTVTDNATLDLGFTANGSLANTLAGTGQLQKTGTSTVTLTGTGSNVGSVDVQQGTLQLGQTGVLTAGTYTTEAGAETTVGIGSQLNVLGAFTQAADSVLNVAIGPSNLPIVSAATATANGTLTVSNFDTTLPASVLTITRYDVLHTTGGITGNFTALDFGGAVSSVDYLQVNGAQTPNGLDYTVGFGLTWLAGATLGNGVFTLAAPASSFNVDLALANQSASATGWDGTTLTKEGAGNLLLSAVNSYTGPTLINAGTLTAGIANAFATSSAVTVNGGATLALNGFNQIVNDLSGAGTVNLGSAVMSANNTGNTAFSGLVSGTGSMTKTGTGTLTLSGANTYSGGTTITAGTLTATNGSALGTGAVTDNATLDLGFAANGSLANTLTGTGVVQKTGAGTATLTGTGSNVGSVNVQQGTLQFGQAGVFNAGSYATQGGATTALGGVSQLAVTGAFTQAAGSALDVVIGTNNPIVTAGSAALDGTLAVTGFSTSAPTSASALTSSGFTIVHTTGGITGDFSSVNLGGAASTVDYLTLGAQRSPDNLNYSVGFGLTWQAGATLGNGVFTLANAPDTFNVDLALSNQAASATGWNGTDLTKSGAGTLTLSAANTYTGQTIINGGTLATGIANSFATSSAVTVNSGATLALNGFSQIANNLSGAGSITLGSATLTASNGATDTVFAGTISGAGSLAKTGAGTLSLSGSNIYAGGTTISAGTLSGSATSFGSGVILDNASLVIDQAADASFANAINGTGTFTKSGSGSLNLTGTSALSGATTVTGGRLAVNGSLANSALTVQSGAILGGNGTIGRTSVLSGGTVAPGNSIGALAVNGPFTQAAGSTYQVQVDPGSTAADLIRVNGTATLAPGAILDVLKFTPGEYSANSNYTVLTATGGVTGTYLLTGDVGGAFYALTDTYDSSNVYLNAVRVRNFVDAAGTPNEIAAAGALQNLPDGNPLRNAVAALANDAQARGAFDQLSGEIHASIKTALVEDSRYIRDAAVDRVRQSFCMPGAANRIATARLTGTEAATTATDEECAANAAEPAAWVHVLGAWGHVDGDGNAATMRQNLGGILMGVDTTIAQQWRVGALAGYSGGNFNVDDRNSSAGSDNYHVGLYGGTQWGNLGLRAGAAYTWHSINTTRSPAFAGYADNLKDDYNAHTVQVFGDIGYRMNVQQVALEPFASVAYVNLNTGSINEQGGAAALAGAGGSTNSTFTTLGMRGAIDFALGNRTVVTASGTLGWRHAFGSVVPTSTLAFSGGSPFVVAAVPIARDAALVEAGLDFQITPTASLGVTYGGQFGSGTTSQSVQGTLKVRF